MVLKIVREIEIEIDIEVEIDVEIKSESYSKIVRMRVKNWLMFFSEGF